MDKCPGCGADSRAHQDYYCGTKWYHGGGSDYPLPGFLRRSSQCYETELAALRARLEKVEGLLRKIEERSRYSPIPFQEIMMWRAEIADFLTPTPSPEIVSESGEPIKNTWKPIPEQPLWDYVPDGGTPILTKPAPEDEPMKATEVKARQVSCIYCGGDCVFYDGKSHNPGHLIPGWNRSRACYQQEIDALRKLLMQKKSEAATKQLEAANFIEDFLQRLSPGFYRQTIFHGREIATMLRNEASAILRTASKVTESESA